jgi:hypothetical protein
VAAEAPGCLVCREISGEVAVLPRYAETPQDVPWHAVDECDGARRGGAAEITELVARLRAAQRLKRRAGALAEPAGRQRASA